MQQPRKHMSGGEESKPLGGHSRRKQDGMAELGQFPQSKSITINQQNYHRTRKGGRNTPGGLSQKWRRELD